MGEQIPELTPRKLYLIGEVDNKICGELISQIDYINEYDSREFQKLFEQTLDVVGDYMLAIQLTEQNFQPEPITLIIDTPGGYVSSGLSLIETIVL